MVGGMNGWLGGRQLIDGRHLVGWAAVGRLDGRLVSSAVGLQGTWFDGRLGR